MALSATTIWWGAPRIFAPTGKRRLHTAHTLSGHSGYGQEDLLEGVCISGASVVHERIKTGAATLSF
jgi:hypothetical protein